MERLSERRAKKNASGIPATERNDSNLEVGGGSTRNGALANGG